MSTDPEFLQSPPADRAAAPRSVQELPELPGVDVDLAMSRLGGNLPLYRQILAIFAKSHARVVDDITRALESGQHDVALRLSHTMRGVAATLGADGLAQSFQAVEAALQAGDTVRARHLLVSLGVPVASLVCAISTMP